MAIQNGKLLDICRDCKKRKIPNEGQGHPCFFCAYYQGAKRNREQEEYARMVQADQRRMQRG